MCRSAGRWCLCFPLSERLYRVRPGVVGLTFRIDTHMCCGWLCSLSRLCRCAEVQAPCVSVPETFQIDFVPFLSHLLVVTLLNSTADCSEFACGVQTNLLVGYLMGQQQSQMKDEEVNKDPLHIVAMLRSHRPAAHPSTAMMCRKGMF